MYDHRRNEEMSKELNIYKLDEMVYKCKQDAEFIKKEQFKYSQFSVRIIPNRQKKRRYTKRKIKRFSTNEHGKKGK